jgi:hypothetical protein
MSALLAVGGVLFTLYCPRTRPTVRDEYRASDAVVLAKVIRETAVPATRDYSEGTAYVVRVDETLKGKPPTQIRLFSENSSGRFPMRVGTQYLLFVDNLQRSVIDNCGNSGMVSSRRHVLSVVRSLRRNSARKGS